MIENFGFYDNILMKFVFCRGYNNEKCYTYNEINYLGNRVC